MLLVILTYFGYKNREYVQQLPIGCAFKTKTLCDDVFVSGRDPLTIEREDLGFTPLFKLFEATIDRGDKSVTCSLLGTGLIKKRAVFVSQLGCVLLSGVPEERIRAWRPAIPPPEPVNAEAVPWPMGDLLPQFQPPANIDMAKLNSDVDHVFIETNSKKKLYTRALIIIYDGRLIAERYGPNIRKDTPLLSWSMAKSVTNAVVGILKMKGKLALDGPVAVPEWQKVGDPRQAITLGQLLRMNSGLEWIEAYAERPVSDVNIMLFLKPDMAAFAAAKCLAAQPGNVWHYSGGTTNLICKLIRNTFANREAYWEFPRRELFNKIGMHSAIWETDASGTFIGSSYLYATARDYARFGILYLNKGLWQGKRILPEGWVDYSTTPTPAAPKGQYGDHFWLNKGKDSNPTDRMFPQLPSDAFFAMGYQGQTIAIIPSRKLVVVRLGMTYDDDWGMEAFIKSILDAIH
jgi:CubicO group peptidase (beta-lactamase class C family)